MKEKEFIPVYTPFVAKNQKEYVIDCIDTNWISSRGKYVEKFETNLQEYLEVKHAITVSNGSVSLMLILKALDIGPGDEVITQSLTYAATVSSIENVGAIPVLVDSDFRFQMDLDKVEKAISEKTKAIMVAQLYGDSCGMLRLQMICDKHKIHLIEDSAEAFGCHTVGKMIGSYGVASSFSFFANKVITTGEGSCVCTNDDNLAHKMRLLKSQNHIGGFQHIGPGYNFRLTNLACAIGVAQLEHIDEIIEKKKSLAAFYRKNLDPSIEKVIPVIGSSEWMPLFILPKTLNYLKFNVRMNEEKIDVRPCFTPVHLMSGFNFRKGTDLSTAERIYKGGFNLPSSPTLTEEELTRVVETVNKIIKETH